MADSYIVYNGPMLTTTAFAGVTTGTAIKTMLQIRPAVPIEVIEWGISFDGAAEAARGKCELITTGTVYATVTALAATGVQKYNDPNAPTNTAGTGGTPLNLGTTHSGYTATAEGTITATRVGDAQYISPMGQYVKQFPLGERFKVAAQEALRIRVHFAAAINSVCYVIFAV